MRQSYETARRAEAQCVKSHRGFQALQGIDDLRAAGGRLVALFALALDDLFGRVLDKFGIAELLVDALDVGLGLLHFLVEPNALGGDINQSCERQTYGFAAN